MKKKFVLILFTILFLFSTTLSATSMQSGGGFKKGDFYDPCELADTVCSMSWWDAIFEVIGQLGAPELMKLGPACPLLVGAESGSDYWNDLTEEQKNEYWRKWKKKLYEQMARNFCYVIQCLPHVKGIRQLKAACVAGVIGSGFARCWAIRQSCENHKINKLPVSTLYNDGTLKFEDRWACPLEEHEIPSVDEFLSCDKKISACNEKLSKFDLDWKTQANCNTECVRKSSQHNDNCAQDDNKTHTCKRRDIRVPVNRFRGFECSDVKSACREEATRVLGPNDPTIEACTDMCVIYSTDGDCNSTTNESKNRDLERKLDLEEGTIPDDDGLF